ncbi:MAG: FKBP-type peptidyl-prolyl cis-trans isomerase [Bacteroidales bacterium]|nr:FKBP-type peptidyl-prolyl cis-trans isomerase [Bacteroidales bacterium]
MRSTAIVLLAVVLCCCSCGNKESGFKQHPSGLSYRFYELNNEGQMPKTGDILVLSMKVKTLDDKVIDESNYYRMQLSNPMFKGDFFTGLALLQVGDSACFKLDAARFFEKNRKRDVPVEFKPGDPVFVYVRLKNILSAEDLDGEKETAYHTDRDQEMSLLRDYLSMANVTVSPTKSGLYYIEKKRGTGKKAEIGKTLVVHYTGTTIDGKVFDSSLQKGKPFSFILGKNQVIRGWDEAFLFMHEGGVARFIIPSDLAYGKDGFSNVILPYSTLVFEVELLEVN